MFEAEKAEFLGLLKVSPDLKALPPGRLERLSEFYGLVLLENEVQNLTRLLSPLQFFQGHVLDAVELEKSGVLEGSLLDLGTGLGSPGLIHGILFDRPWVLCDSEKQKVSFIDRAASTLELKRISTTTQRAESYLNTHRVGTVVSKAVGKIEKIFSWIGPCSTWNRIVLMKGPAWDSEWAEFLQSKFRSKLALQSTHPYVVDGEVRRIIVSLNRK